MWYDDRFVVPAQAGIQEIEAYPLDSRLRGNDTTQTGYTLIELLIALLIYSVVAVLISNSLSNLLNSREKNQAHSVRLNEIQLALTLVERDMEQIINRPIKNSIGRIDPALLMDANQAKQRIDFTRMGYINPLAVYPRSTLQRVAYQYDKDKLIRLTWPTLDQTQNVTPGERIILTGVTKMQWQFYDKDNKTYTVWPPIATAMYSIPRAIQLTLILKDKGQVDRFFVLPENSNVFTAQ